jgi:hypothetical protein
LLAAAGCYLPLTRDESVDANLGTRHRAAIGISQETDAIVIVVSEENAIISIVVDGVMKRNLDGQDLRKTLRDYFSDSETTIDGGSQMERSPDTMSENVKLGGNGILSRWNHLKVGRRHEK